MNIVFEQGAFEDFTNWASEDKQLYSCKYHYKKYRDNLAKMVRTAYLTPVYVRTYFRISNQMH